MAQDFLGSDLRTDRRGSRASAFTLVELLIAVAIMAVLVGALVTVGTHVRTNARIKNTESTIHILTAALQEYNDYHGGFPSDNYDFSGADYVHVAGDHATFSDWDDKDDVDDPPYDGELAKRRAAMASVEVMYWRLDQIPGCHAILSRLPGAATANDDRDSVTSDGQTKTLIEVNDAWGHPIGYAPQSAGNVPVLTSAGPDGILGNADDIISSEL